MRDIAGILLAAGRSERFGGHKLLATLPDGMPVAVRTAQTLRRVLPDVLAVVRPGDAELMQIFRREGLSVHECVAADRGMGASLACGIAARPDADAWLVALADMPYVEAATCQQVVQAITRGAALAAPVYRGQRGHPVGFNAKYRDALLALDGDQGARALLAAEAGSLTLIDVDDSGIRRDIDVPLDARTTVTS